MATVMTKRNINENTGTHVSKTTEMQERPVQKRFMLEGAYNKVVFDHRRVLSGKWAKDSKPEPAWEDALKDLLKSHPATKDKLKAMGVE